MWKAGGDVRVLEWISLGFGSLGVRFGRLGFFGTAATYCVLGMRGKVSIDAAGACTVWDVDWLYGSEEWCSNSFDPATQGSSLTMA